MDTMKKTLVLLTCILVLALGATAQEQLNFFDLPLVSTPTPLPNGYGQLTWSNFFYVDPAEWAGAGFGYKLGPDRGDVAFIGEQHCLYEPTQGRVPFPVVCFGSISSAGGPFGFQPVSALVAGGFGPTSITVTAYNNGKYVGSSVYNLTTTPQHISFPFSWGPITEMVIGTEGAGENFVLFNLNVYALGG
jgi:hypothetical protein